MTADILIRYLAGSYIFYFVLQYFFPWSAWDLCSAGKYIINPVVSLLCVTYTTWITWDFFLLFLALFGLAFLMYTPNKLAFDSVTSPSCYLVLVMFRCCLMLIYQFLMTFLQYGSQGLEREYMYSHKQPLVPVIETTPGTSYGLISDLDDQYQIL